MRIDAHQHFWRYDPVRDNWITDEMTVLQRDFLLSDLEPLLAENGFDGCIAVQASQSEGETNYLLSLAEQADYIKGVVGWVDLQAENIEQRLAHYRQFSIVKGFRHILQGEEKRDLMLTPAFKRGMAALQEVGYTYDILIYPDQLPYTKQLVAAFPALKFVLDHLAKPLIKAKEIDEWRRDIEALANYPNVYCKLSGLVTEADWKNWREDDFTDYIDVMVNAFGTGRIMFGSDWPVCLLAAEYSQVVQLVTAYFSDFSFADQQKIFGQNASEFYKIE